MYLYGILFIIPTNEFRYLMNWKIKKNVRNHIIKSNEMKGRFLERTLVL